MPISNTRTIPITLRFFAQIRVQANRSHWVLPIAVGTSLRELLALLSKEIPALASPLKSGPILTVVNHRQVSEEYILQPNDEVAFLPPFSGGSGEGS